MSKKKIPFMARQGDVLITAVDSIPNGETATPDKARGFVLAYGEESGHAHSIVTAQVERAILADGAMFLEMPNGGTLRHEHGGQPTGDHDWIDVPPGKYRGIRQREWTGSVSRMVAD